MGWLTDTCGKRRDVVDAHSGIYSCCQIKWRVVLNDFGYSSCVQRRAVPQEVFG